MNTFKRLNLLGISLFFLFIIFTQVLWLFDPIRLGQNTYWIDVLDSVLYMCIFIPLIWLISAACGIYYNDFHYVLFLIRVSIIGCSIIAIYFILNEIQDFIWIVATLAVTCTLVLVDKIIDDLLEYTKIPRKALMVVAASVAAALFLLLPTSYTVTYPGLTVNMNKFAQVVGGGSKGEISGVLIFERPAFPVDWVYAQLFPQYEFKKRKGTDLPLREQLQRVHTMKLEANEIASAVAFQKTGLGQGFTSRGAVITGLLSETPAADLLQIGDIIININGHSVHSVNEFKKHISTTQPGMDIHLTIIRSTEEIVFITQTHYNPEDMSQAILGAYMKDDIHYDIPQEVVYYSYLLHQGGPSHGAMLALTLINQLTPNGVTNGNIVAGTGTIGVDGSIGRIGGIKQKAYTVERAGADVFFVPADQYNDALEGAEHLHIVPVRSLTDILVWLDENPKH